MPSSEDLAEAWWAERRKWDEIVAAKMEEVGETSPEFHTWLCEMQEWRHAVEAQADGTVNPPVSG